jgi:hypothetical protein
LRFINLWRNHDPEVEEQSSKEREKAEAYLEEVWEQEERDFFS